MNNNNRVALAPLNRENLPNMTTHHPMKKDINSNSTSALASGFHFQPPPSAQTKISNAFQSSDCMEVEEQRDLPSTATITKEDLFDEDNEFEEVNIVDQHSSSCLDISTEPSDPYDIDSGDTEDPSFVSSYVKEIFKYLKERESVSRDRADPNYLENQTEIKERHRSTLVDWMVDVAFKFELNSDTLLMAINYMDRYLSHNGVAKTKVQLVGTAALMIAAKYEEIYCPEVNDYVWITAKAYTKEEFLKMEKDILVDLQFQLVYPTSLQFLRRFSKAAESEPRTHTLSKYFCELASLDTFFLKFKPSQIAAAAVFIAKAMLDTPLNQIWSPTVQHHSGYSIDEIAPIVQHLNELHASIPTGPYQAIYKKYSSQKFMGVALILPISNLKLN